MKYILLLLVLGPLHAHAYFQMDFLKNKNSAKASSRWTLADWITQKNKGKLADQWLAANRSAGELVEVNLGGGLNNYQVKTGAASAAVDRKSQSYQLDAYISFFNLMAEYEKTDDDKETYAAAAGLRLLGASSQTTNLVLRYGLRELRDLNTKTIWKNAFAEGQLQLYVTSFFGLLGKYRHYFPHDSSQGSRLAGHRATAGAFMEFGILRLYGNYYVEPMEVTPSGGTVIEQERTGYEYGIKLFF